MRVLYLTDGFPYPLTSGHLRHYYFMRELSRHHRITLLSLVGPQHSPEHVEAMRPYTEDIFTYTAEGRGRSMLGKTEHAILTALAGGKATTQMRDEAKQLLDTRAFDVVLFSGREAYAAIDGLDLPPLVADLTDAFWLRIRLQLDVAPKYKVPGLWYKYLRVRRVEQELLERAVHSIVASTRDRDALASGARSDISVVPNGVDFNFWSRQSRELGQNTIVFTGAMNYAPNVDAALVLAHDILPLVRQAVPDVQLFIVGHSPKPAVVAAGQEPGVTVTGFVDDVRPYLERASVFVAPLRFGAGIQNKLLEAMAMEVPSVASTLAADGLVTENGDTPPVRTADSAPALAELVCEELQRQTTDRQPATDARRYVERYFDWRVSGEKVNQILQQAVGVAPV